MIIGTDYHPSFQPIAFIDTETRDYGEQRLQHRKEAKRFYRDLAAREVRLRVWHGSREHARWFERPLAELNPELWIGDPAEIRSKRVRKAKTEKNGSTSSALWPLTKSPVLKPCCKSVDASEIGQ